MLKENGTMIADYNFWIKFDEWNIEQMAALLLGYNPMYFDRKLIEELKLGIVETSMTDRNIDILTSEYDRTYALILSSIEAGAFKSRVTPLKCYKWALNKGVPIFKEFHEAIKNRASASERSEHNSDINAKRKKQLYKIILSLAIKYKFNPERSKNPHTAKIRDAIHRSGLNIDDNTIREVVRTSYEIYKDEIDHSIFES